MADGRRREEWVHTSHILAAICNIMRDTRKHGAVSAAKLNPFATAEERGDRPAKKVGVGFLKALFVDNDQAAVMAALEGAS